MWLRRIALPLFGVMWVLLSAFAPTASPKTPKNVLVLYPEQPDLPAQRLFDQSLRASLMAKIADRIDFYTEYMEVSRFHGEQHLQLLHEFYRRKYRERQMDLIIAVTRRPLEFLLTYRQEVFPATPVVFCAIDPGPLHSLPVGPQITGFVRHLDFKATMEVVLRLHPQTRRVVFMSGTSSTDHYYRALAWSQLRDYEAKLEFIDLGALPMPELLKRVAQLPQETVIFLGTFFLDSTGRSFIPQEAMSLVTQTANAPLYSIFDTFLGQGMVGGHLYSHEALGVRVAELGARILQGEAPEDLPIRRDDTNVYLFDWRQLRRWGIREDRLPPGSVVHYKEMSVWEQYRGYVLAGGVLCGIETLLIITLLVQRKRRRLAEQGLAERLRFETLSADLSATFVNMGPSADLEKSILLSLQQVTEFFGADRGNLAEFKEPTDVFHITHSWAAAGCATRCHVGHQLAASPGVRSSYWVGVLSDVRRWRSFQRRPPPIATASGRPARNRCSWFL